MKSKNLFSLRYICMLLAMAFILGGCVTKNSDTATMAGDMPLEELPPISSPVGSFNDIEIPEGMKYVNKDSISISTDSFRGGIVHYRGRIDAYSLKDFIISSMEKNKWKLAGEVSSKDVILAFTKPNRTCMMNIQPNSAISNTTLTMYVTIDLAASQSLNAFGEPIN